MPVFTGGAFLYLWSMHIAVAEGPVMFRQYGCRGVWRTGRRNNILAWSARQLAGRNSSLDRKMNPYSGKMCFL